MFKRKYIISTAFVVLIIALLAYQNVTGKSRIIDIAIFPLTILEQGVSKIIKGAESFFNTYIMLAGKELENKRLYDKIKRLEEEKHIYIEAELENRRLRGILGLKSERADFATSAEVFARDPGNWFQVLWINKGSDDGVDKEMVALTPSGIVGRTHRVLSNSASIILVTDVNSAVAVRLQSSRAEGILEGRGGNRCYLKYVPSEVKIEIGEKVISSGLDGIFPEGHLIGHVTALIKNDGGIFHTIEVRPSQDLNALEEIALLKR